MKTHRYLLTITLLLTGLPFASQSAEESFKVCADPINPPYSTKELTGYENKIAQLFAKQLGQKLEFTWLPDRIGFVRNTLKAENENGNGYKCDVIMGIPVGSELTDTTIPYLHSSYVLLIAKGRGWDKVTDPAQLTQLDPSKQEKLKIAMFDRGPGTEWLQMYGLLEQGVPYQSMTGDSEHNTAMTMDADLKQGKIDMAILWGPMAAYVQSKSAGHYIALPMQSNRKIRFDYSIAMGVRQSDKSRKSQLNELIAQNMSAIHEIIDQYHVLQLPLVVKEEKKDND
jgi:quinoprotein dehydrogenase-associated probable ABC transporter substrate-binding protein